MKLAALCCTYRRPHLLGHLIESFRRQTYPQELRELIILDDAGQFEHQAREGWRIISIPRRFHSLGEKRNACAALASADVAGFLVADDDDVFLPHWFASHAEALRRAEWSRPSLILTEQGGALREHPTGGLYHGNWAFRRETFYRVGGYAALNNGEDQDLAHRLRQAGASECDPCQFAPPFFVCRFNHDSYHVSQMDDQRYRELAAHSLPTTGTLQIGWPLEYATLPVQRWYDFGPQVASSCGKRPVELVRPVEAPGRDGLSNGMFALQSCLRRRIAQGLDWLRIGKLPVSRGALPWFWHYDDRTYALWWNDQGQPFVQGPNVLFLNSARPRVDADECRLLDAAHCRGMLCHSDWYRDLIAHHQGPDNRAPITLCPYPIDPCPGEPLPAEYDLLLYSKNGYRPQLLEHLARVFPRNRQIHYGQYHREELYEAARRSQACAYLADDDHGPLALQEILLAGCPTVGVRTGAAFVRDGVTGALVSRLPPGPECFERDSDGEALAAFRAAIDRAQSLSRIEVRAAALEEFDLERITDRVVAFLDRARTDP